MDVSRLFYNAEEHPEPLEASIQGTIPDWLRGTYYKIGPGKFDLPGGFTVNHYFDGYAIIYQFKIKDGKKVVFRARFVESDAYKRAMAIGKPTFTEYGTKAYPDPARNVVSRAISKVLPSDMTDNVIGNLFSLQGRLFAATESSFLRVIDPENLDTKEKVDLWKSIGVNFCSSHYIRDRDGWLYNTGTSLFPMIKYHVFKVPPTSEKNDRPLTRNPFRDAVEVASFSASWKTCFAYNHSFTLTDNYIVYVEQPYVINLVKLLATQVKGKSLKDCMDWLPEEKTRFCLIEKATGHLIKARYEASSMFFYHFVNAYEDRGHIVVDLLGHNSPVMCDKFYLNNMRQSRVYDTPDHPGLRRYVLPLVKTKEQQMGVNLVLLSYTTASAEKTSDDAITLFPEFINDVGFDHPCINVPRCLGRNYRYFYAGGLYGEDTIYRRSVFKMDLVTRQIKTWKNAEECIMGEPLFIPTPNATDEDDGVILATGSDIRPEHPSILVVLDAKTMTELARVEISIPLKVLNHSYFIPLDCLD